MTAAGNWLFMPAEWEFVETGEELEVGKAARVVEEVAVLPDGEIRRTRR
ncbi:MAG: hypothetical protein SFV54_26960 [Bryobacteraceae bacterium]|nr:hypothetical protein [Bryobacteraceae bacterium]